MIYTVKTDSVQVFGLCNVYYDSYYIQGLQDYFGIKNIKFNTADFPNFNQGTFAAIITRNGQTVKMIIDSRDSNQIWPAELEWCDVYGKVNYNAETTPQIGNDKIFPIGPSFGIRVWNLPQALAKAFRNSIRFKKSIADQREFLANYWRQYTRFPLATYFKKETSRGFYIFFMGTIWQKEAQTNLFRSNFIYACKKNKNIEFEGGFAPRKDGNNFGFDNIVTEKRYPLAQYMSKIKQSVIVFNTPAVLSCHGWKLGEFLAMGKAMVSTVHLNVLPAPLEDGTHLMYVDGNDIADYDKKIAILLESETQRKLIETNAKAYFETYLSPRKVIEILYSIASK